MQAERAGVRMEARQGQDDGEYRRGWFTTAVPAGHAKSQSFKLEGQREYLWNRVGNDGRFTPRI